MSTRVLLAAALTIAVTANALAAFTAPAELVVVSDDNYPPYLFRSGDGTLQGITKDRWALWSRKTGVPVRVEGMVWAVAQESVRNGAGDVVDPIIHTQDRGRLYEFSPPYAPVDARIFFHQTISGIHDVGSLRGFTVGAKDASACALWLGERGIETVHGYARAEDVIKAAGAGEIRLFCMDSPSARYYLFKAGVADEFRESPPLYSTEFHWAVKKGRTGLSEFIQNGFRQITAEELRDIDTRWLGNPLRFPIDKRYWLYLAAIALALLSAAALLIVWNRTLRSRVAARTAELRVAMAALQQRADEIQDLYNNAPCGYHSLNSDGIIVRMNDTELKWLGYTREDLVGKRKFMDFLTAEGQQVFAVKFAKLKETGQVSDVEYEVSRKDGSKLSVLLSATIVRDQEGHFLFSRATLYDITDRKRAEAALATSERRYRTIINTMGEAVLLRAPDGTVLAANPACEALLGPEAREINYEVVRRGGWTAIREDGSSIPESEWPTELTRLTGEPHLATVVCMKRPDGTPHWLSMSVVPVLEPGATPPYSVVICASDITQQKRAEQTLREHADMLQGLSRRLMEVEESERRKINRELHDRIGQNLSALGITLNLIRSGLTPQSLPEADARVRAATKMLENTVAQIRDVMTDLHPPALDDFGLFAALRDYLQSCAAVCDVPISLRGEDLAPRLPPAAETALFRIAQGALANAIAHARARHIEVVLAATGDRVMLTIADDGKGFDPEPGVLARSPWGLSVMRERATAVGAELQVDSAPGRGTRIEVEIARGTV